MTTKKPNGSTDLLAKAMRDVFAETVGEAIKPLEGIVRQT